MQHYEAETTITWAMSPNTRNHCTISMYNIKVKLKYLPVKLNSHAVAQWNEVNELFLFGTVTDHIG